MHKVTGAFLILTAGWGLGWFTHHYWGVDSKPATQPAGRYPPPPAAVPQTPRADVTLSAPDRIDSMTKLLQRGDFAAVLERYESLQAQADDAAASRARNQILIHADTLIAERRYPLAEQLLQRFLSAAHRDVEARVRLAIAYRGQGELRAAVDQLYEARAYAYRPAMLQEIARRIRSAVAELARDLKQKDDHNTLLALYQHLTQLEPDHARWFIGLAGAQLAVDDMEAARRSLLLIAQDPDVGAQAQDMLSRLSIALAGTQDSEAPTPDTSIAGIPLHRRGNHFMVDAGVAYGETLRLLIDTGASMTILTPDALERHNIRYEKTGRTRVFTTANGRVRAPIYRLERLSVGDWQVRQLEIGVLDLGGRSAIEGLLGMNFLSHFQFFIDQNENLLRLSAN